MSKHCFIFCENGNKALQCITCKELTNAFKNTHCKENKTEVMQSLYKRFN